MKDHQIFCKLDIERWVFGAIEKVQNGAEWNGAWQETYGELGGQSEEVMKKGCPMKGAQTLYELGRIKDGGKQRKNPPLQDILSNHSKNGVYAVLALEELQQNSDISVSDLWEKIQARMRSDLCEEPAASNQGGPTIAFKLWHLGLTV